MKKQVKQLLVLTTLSLSAPLAFSQTLEPWMSPEVVGAWKSGYKGQGAAITVVDQFSSGEKYHGSFTGSWLDSMLENKSQRHGYWTKEEAGMIAPFAAMKTHDFSNTNAVQLFKRGLNVINVSYARYSDAGYKHYQFEWNAREQSIIEYANNGSAVISKSAGNDDGTAVGSANSSGKVDYLSSFLINSKSAIFVGALNKNGTRTSKASIASYSNVAGENAAVQNKFLVVGVTGGNDLFYTLYGTSFAAPVISGYSAILGSKFKSADATQISNQLLATARTDTIANYKASIHGRGEASIARALAPVSIK